MEVAATDGSRGPSTESRDGCSHVRVRPPARRRKGSPGTDTVRTTEGWVGYRPRGVVVRVDAPVVPVRPEIEAEDEAECVASPGRPYRVQGVRVEPVQVGDPEVRVRAVQEGLPE